MSQKPVWTMEIIEVEPNNMGLTLGYLDDHWMRVLEEAKRQGIVLSYHRFSEALVMASGSQTSDANSIVLLTEYKNLDTFSGREKTFAWILKHLPSSTSGLVPVNGDELYKIVDTRVLLEQPAEAHAAQFKLLDKN